MAKLHYISRIHTAYINVYIYRIPDSSSFRCLKSLVTNFLPKDSPFGNLWNCLVTYQKPRPIRSGAKPPSSGPNSKFQIPAT